MIPHLGLFRFHIFLNRSLRFGYGSGWNRTGTEPNRTGTVIKFQKRKVRKKFERVSSNSIHLNSSSVDWIVHVITKTKSTQCFQNEPIRTSDSGVRDRALDINESDSEHEVNTASCQNPGPSAKTKRKVDKGSRYLQVLHTKRSKGSLSMQPLSVSIRITYYVS
jgi:hypothetical protein